MPIYEFHCEQCGKDSEVLVRSSDWRGTTCPHCGSKKLKKQLSVFASSGGGEEPMPACGLSPQSGCGCCGGGPHRH